MTWVIYIFSFLFAVVIGSFLNVVIYRLPLMLNTIWHRECTEFLDQPINNTNERYNLVVPRSRCSHCQCLIKWWQNIPLLSYLLLKGKCANCQHSISWRYPFVELLTGVLSCVIVWQFGLSVTTALVLIYTWLLICMFFIDLDHHILPDQLTLGLLWLGLLVNCFYYFTTPVNAIIGAVAGYSLLWLIMQVYRLFTGKVAMGHGDFKLLAALGAWLGWHYLPLMIFLAALLGTIVGLSLIALKKHQKSKPLAFGPYLAIAGWIMLIWGPTILASYNNLFGVHY